MLMLVCLVLTANLKMSNAESHCLTHPVVVEASQATALAADVLGDPAVLAGQIK
jgi:hypothetical protein